MRRLLNRVQSYLFLARLWWYFQRHGLRDFERALFFNGFRPQIVSDDTRVYHIGQGGRIEIRFRKADYAKISVTPGRKITYQYRIEPD